MEIKTCTIFRFIPQHNNYSILFVPFGSSLNYNKHLVQILIVYCGNDAQENRLLRILSQSRSFEIHDINHHHFLMLGCDVTY